MKLIDLLSLITDFTLTIVSNEDNDEIARYDGKESIPNELNNKEILSVSAYTEDGQAAIRIQIYD